MYLAYSLLLSLGSLVLIPHFLYQALAHGKYLEGANAWVPFLQSLNKSVR